MISLGRKVYANFKVKSNDQKQITYSKVSVILIGSGGTGKSMLINNLCGPNKKEQIERTTTMNSVFKAKCNKLPNRCILEMTDTTGIEQDSSQSLMKLNQIFQSQKYNAVLLQVKFDCRFEKVISQMKRVTRLLSADNKSNIIYLISYADLIDTDCQSEEEILSVVTDSLSKNGFKQSKVILFSNRNSDFETLAKAIYIFGKGKEATKIELNFKIQKYYSPILEIQLKQHQASTLQTDIGNKGLLEPKVYYNPKYWSSRGRKKLKRIISRSSKMINYQNSSFNHHIANTINDSIERKSQTLFQYSQIKESRNPSLKQFLESRYVLVTVILIVLIILRVIF